MTDKNQVDDIVAMLDNMVTNGHGHINVSVDDTIPEGEKTDETSRRNPRS